MEKISFSKAGITVLGIPFKKATVAAQSDGSVYLGGEALGVKLYTGSAVVTALSSVETESGMQYPAKESGLLAGDIITAVNDEGIDGITELREYIKSGEEMKLSVLRSGKAFSAVLRPALSKNGSYKAGMWIRDSCAGLGTVTFVDQSGVFASLGHGISDSDTGVLMPLAKGKVCDAKISGITKGKQGSPGELLGSMIPFDTGVLISNTEVGLFGSFDGDFYSKRELIDIAPKGAIHTGSAQIVCTVDKNGAQRYSVQIARIDPADKDTKNFIIKITDKRLLEATGGIVQGMSGSPVIQDGKLVGAVTHVTLNDPTKGYGIFIENMLANMPNG